MSDDLMVRCRCMGDDSAEAKAMRGWRKRLPRHIIGVPGCGWRTVRKASRS
jgi:hypothetical protein